MLLHNTIEIAASREQVLEAAYCVEEWPRLLSHYRWVRVLREEGQGRIVEMAARRGPIPLRWTARQWRNDLEGRVYFQHLKGPTRGMKVFWEVSERGADGLTQVTIQHDLRSPLPVVGPLAARWIVGALFIHPTAARTLLGIKRHLETTG